MMSSNPEKLWTTEEVCKLFDYSSPKEMKQYLNSNGIHHMRAGEKPGLEYLEWAPEDFRFLLD